MLVTGVTSPFTWLTHTPPPPPAAAFRHQPQEATNCWQYKTRYVSGKLVKMLRKYKHFHLKSTTALRWSNIAWLQDFLPAAPQLPVTIFHTILHVSLRGYFIWFYFYFAWCVTTEKANYFLDDNLDIFFWTWRISSDRNSLCSPCTIKSLQPIGNKMLFRSALLTLYHKSFIHS